ncbi:MAG: hypothetical protein Ta2G_03620 [Termitinemataceae bacterium]|nr:MAG: hypothetical protein Ta2G_03620 [Termitinemataceae bacterium]
MKKVIGLAAVLAVFAAAGLVAQEEGGNAEKLGLKLELGFDFGDVTYAKEKSSPEGEDLKYGDPRYNGEDPGALTVYLPYAIFSRTVGIWTFDAELKLGFTFRNFYTDGVYPQTKDDKALGVTFNFGDSLFRTTVRPIEALALYGEIGDGERFGLGGFYTIIPGLKAGLEAQFHDWYDYTNADGDDLPGGLFSNLAVAFVPEIDFDFAPIFGHVKWSIADGYYGEYDVLSFAFDKDYGATSFVNKNFLEVRIGANLLSNALMVRATVTIPTYTAGYDSANDKEYTGIQSEGITIRPRVLYNINSSLYAYFDAKILGIGADKDYATRRSADGKDARIGFAPALFVGYKL